MKTLLDTILELTSQGYEVNFRQLDIYPGTLLVTLKFKISGQILWQQVAPLDPFLFREYERNPETTRDLIERETISNLGKTQNEANIQKFNHLKQVIIEAVRKMDNE